MIRQSTVDLLREMRFGGMASELERQISDAESFRELSFEDRLALLVRLARRLAGSISLWGI